MTYTPTQMLSFNHANYLEGVQERLISIFKNVLSSLKSSLVLKIYCHIGQYNYLQVSTKSHVIWDNEFHDICVLILWCKSNQRGVLAILKKLFGLVVQLLPSFCSIRFG